jgi:two-component system chemotaxis response regulator CheY
VQVVLKRPALRADFRLEMHRGNQLGSDTNGRHTVLVVDDHPELRKVLRQVLERSGYHVELAENGAAGLERVRRGSIDLIVLDIDMPIMNGRAFLALRARDTALARIPVVVYSADPQPPAVPAGVSAWVWKGTEVSELLQALSTHRLR